jgi:hypothetical protein
MRRSQGSLNRRLSVHGLPPNPQIFLNTGIDAGSYRWRKII